MIAFYIVAAERTGVKSEQLSGTIQNDILKESVWCATPAVYPPAQSMKIIADIFQFTSKKMPKFNSISISGYQHAGSGGNGRHRVGLHLGRWAGIHSNRTGSRNENRRFCSPTFVFWGIGMNHFMEIAKLRAGRLIWAKLMKQFNPKDGKSLALRTHCQTSGWSLSMQDPFNNVARTTIEAAAAAFGGTQSLHTNALDEAIALPTDFSARIARNTQIYLQEETKITKTVDTWAGSYYVESLTDEIAEKAWKLIEEVEELGGMTKAIESEFQNCALKKPPPEKQARIDGNRRHHRWRQQIQAKKEDPLQILDVDNQMVRQQQMEQLELVKANRNTQKVQLSLEKLTLCAQTGDGNLLELAIESARNRASLGEISAALETVFGRYKAQIKSFSGVYSKEIKDDEKLHESQTTGR